MKGLLVLSLAIMMVLSMGSVALAANNTTKLLGTWEVDMGEEGKMTMHMSTSGFATYSQGGKELGEFVFTVRENMMVSAMLGEDGKALSEAVEITFVDEATATAMEEGEELTFRRTEAPEVTEMALDNAFIGTWVADLPEVPGMVMEYKTNGTYSYKGGEYEGDSNYMVIGDSLISIGDDGMPEVFTFAVVDENTIDVTEISSGEVVRFVRQVSEEKAA